MRAAFVTAGDTKRLTGGYLYNRRLLEGLEESGVEVEVMVPSGADPAEQATAAPGFGRAFDPAPFDVVVVDALARIVVAPHMDAWRSVRPVVTLVHELPGAADPSLADRERPFEFPLLRSGRLVAVSRHGKEVLLDRGVPAGRVAVVPPGFDGLERHPEQPRAGGVLRVVCVAQWIPRKGILDLVRAWRTGDRSGAVLDLVGETDADAGYAARVREAASVDPSILVHGPVDDATVAGLYASADLFALPSRYEGYGIVYAEALSFGLPVIACAVGPVPEVLGDEAALLVPPGDIDALSGALGRLLSDAGLREKLSAAARRRAAGLPRWRETVEGFLGVLRDVVEERGGMSVPDPAGPRAQNRRSWNAVVGAHDSHRGDLAGFLKAGGSTLFPEETRLLGDLSGRTVAHLQCNSGGDTLSLAGLGAEVTGVDLSDEAISSARRLSGESGLPARFVRADVYDWLAESAEGGARFDAVFASYGVVCWLTDLVSWARGIGAIMAPGGRFVLVDFHPAADVFDALWNVASDYPSGGEPLLLEEGVGDYVADSGGGLTPAGFAEGVDGFRNPEPCHLFRWGLGEVVTALAGAGLKITALEEYPYSNGERHFSRMRELPGRRMAPPESVPAVPLMYGIRAEKVEGSR